AAYEISSISGPDDIYHLTYKVITERFQYHLQDLGTRSQPERGIVVCDHRGADNDKRLRRHHQMLIHAPGGPTSVYKNLIEGLFLQPSHQSIGIQLADLVAGAIWRKFERSDSRFYDLVEPIMRRSKLGEVDGYGIARVPKRGWA
ncbi:MAG: DUF3800 domain-containing protein, partial [Rhodospirillales bacterium]|nr:DUF3800 domain-containing protein [Rhodospirillales bacterium]